MRVLQVFGILNIGGAETMLMNLYRKIDREAIQFDFVVHGEERGVFEHEIETLGGHIYRCPKYSVKSAIRYQKWWNDFFKEHTGYQILHSHIRSTASVYLPIAKKHGMKTIIHSHSTSNGKGLSAFVKRIMQYPLRYQADYFTACSREAGEWLFGKKICNGDRFAVINNAIDVKSFVFNAQYRREIRNDFQIPETAFVLGFLARVSEPKNPLFAVEVFAQLRKIIPSSRFLFVGDGELMEPVKARIKALGLGDGVILTGTRVDAAWMFCAMDFYLLPSIWEGFGISLIEAQASGLRCICSENIPKNAIVTDLVKVLPLSSGPEAWADEAVKSAALYARNGVPGKIIAARFDIGENVHKFSDLYYALAER